MSMKRGLPERATMRHDAHFVEELTRRSGRHIGSMIPLEFVEPKSEQPCTTLGNIEELAASIREKGVLEPILVRAIAPNRYQIISGDARAAGELNRDEVRKQTAKTEPKKAGRPKNFTWQVKDKALPFTVNLSFRKASVEKSEIISALQELLRRLEKE